MSEAQENEGVVETPETDDTNQSSIASLDDALKVIADLRRENAAKRVKTKEVEDKAKKWEEYVESQKTDLEKLAESKAALERENNELRIDALRGKVAQEEGVSPELVEFLVGTDEASLRAQAKKLVAAKPNSGGSTDFFAGQRGKPIGSPPKDLNEWFTDWYKNHEGSTKKTF